MNSYDNKTKFRRSTGKLVLSRKGNFSTNFDYILNKDREFEIFRGKKIFCIGRNKTGTSSLKKAMEEMGFIVGDQRKAELLFDDWAIRDFRRLIEYCRTAQFFQDTPFSLPFTYVVLDHVFPGSKFILTIRDNAEQWYNSLTRFHAKMWGKNGRIPTKEDLQNSSYIYKGRAWVNNRKMYNSPEYDPYKKEILIKDYNNHNENVIEYFRHRPKDLLILNVAEKDSYQKLANFLNVKTDKQEFPWENKT